MTFTEIRTGTITIKRPDPLATRCRHPHPLAMSTKSNVDVLVIGAGPAGLMCANGLARAGVNVRVVDQR